MTKQQPEVGSIIIDRCAGLQALNVVMGEKGYGTKPFQADIQFQRSCICGYQQADQAQYAVGELFHVSSTMAPSLRNT